MPDDETILGFSNRWYAKGIETALPEQLEDALEIRRLTPPLFVATKLEAYRGRGEGDLIASRDAEDILLLVDGREQLTTEIAAAESEIRTYIAARNARGSQLRPFPRRQHSWTRGSRRHCLRPSPRHQQAEHVLTRSSSLMRPVRWRTSIVVGLLLQARLPAPSETTSSDGFRLQTIWQPQTKPRCVNMIGLCRGILTPLPQSRVLVPTTKPQSPQVSPCRR